MTDAIENTTSGKKVSVKIKNGQGYDIFSCPTNDYQGLVQVTVASNSASSAQVSVYQNAYGENQSGAHIELAAGTTTVVLGSRVILNVASGSKTAIMKAEIELLGIYPKM
ncbi:hypothetical protein MNBD_ALPHA06-1349 [hydrothermal vent metagenome]|uniref:Uncharacterized protein n=1 Tax=hydrothermal vent metagenome TaxID=652676 RepID=A0A3B0ST43_9ZZZZ